ncbi:MAG: nucleotide-binding domain containing protein, partial [Candidatus Bathyarchaeota archaeon]
VEAAASLGLTSNELETRITDALANTAKGLIEQTPLSGIILSGGATAMAVCAALSVKEISIIEELRPGIPLLRLDDINAVTKAGGFGEHDALIQASQYLKRKHA